MSDDQKNWNLLRARRRKHITTLLMDRCRGRLPDDDAGREYLYELLLVTSTLPHADIKMDYEAAVWAPWMSPAEAAQIIDQIKQIPIWERWRTGKDLGKRLRLTNGERQRMKLWMIWPHNMSLAQLRRQRRRKQRECMRRLRQLQRKLQGKESRQQWLTRNSESRTKPWLELGISRPTYYRRLRAKIGPVDNWRRNAKTPEEKLE